MDSGFWSNNPCVPTWNQQITKTWNKYPASLAEPGQHISKIKAIEGYELRKGIENDFPVILEFWSRYFSISTRSRCSVPLSHIQTCVKEGIWDIYICISKSSGLLVGTGVRRWISNVHIGDVFWKKAAIIDYYCVHPSYRRKGIGRWILGVLQNTGPVPLPPHFIHWEGVQFKIPPACSGMYWVKQRSSVQPIREGICKRVAIQRPHAQWIWNNSSKAFETFSWETSKGILTIWNTFHKRVPDGAWIGILLHGTQEAAEEMLEVGPFGVLLSPSYFSGWSFDSPWQWVIYNCITGMGVQYPFLIM